MGDQVERIVLQVDAESKDAEKNLARLSSEVNDLAKETRRLEKVSRDLNKAMERGENVADDRVKNTIKLERTRKRLADTTRELRGEIDQAAKSEKAFALAQRESAERARLAGDVESRLLAVGGAAGTLGGRGGAAVEQAARVPAEVLASVEAVGLLRQELPQFTANLIESAGGVANLAAGAVALGGIAAVGTVALLAFNKANEKSKEAIRETIAVNERYAEVIATGTTEEVRAAINANEERNKELELERVRLQAIVDGFQGKDGLTGATVDLVDAVGASVGGYGEAKDKLEEVNNELDENARLNSNLSIAIERGSTAAADAKVAEEALATTRENEAARITAALGGLTTEELEQQITRAQNAFDFWQEESLKASEEAFEAAGTAAFADAQARSKAANDQLIASSENLAVLELLRPAAERYTAQLEDVADATSIAEAQSKALKDARNLSIDAAEKELEQNLDRQDAVKNLIVELERLADTNPVAAAELAKYNDELESLTLRQVALTNIIIPSIAAREDEAAAAEFATGAIDDTAAALMGMGDELLAVQMAVDTSADRLSKAGDALADLTQKTAVAESKRLSELEKAALSQQQREAKRRLDIAQDAEKAALDEMNALADHYSDLANIDKDFFDERADILRDRSGDLRDLDKERIEAVQKSNDEQRKLARDHQKRLIAIREDANRTIRSAAARLDAVAIFEAKEAAKAAIKTENEKFEEEKAAREDSLKDQIAQIRDEKQETRRAAQEALQDLRQQHADERNAAISAFNESNARQQQQRALEFAQQQAAWALEDQQRLARAALAAQQRQQFFVAERTAAAQHQGALLQTTIAGMNSVESSFAAGIARMAARAATPTIGGSSRFVAPIRTATPAGITSFRQPARPAGVGALAATNNFNATTNINGAREPAQIANEVKRILKDVFGSRAVG
jgi:hypothetical protein